MRYGQFCPIAKATEILGEKWTILIVREVLMGACRFTEIQRGLGDISPSLLASRLRSLERQGIVARRRGSGERQFEYFPTEACRALLPVLGSIGEWGLLWARQNLLEADLDVDFLMLYLERSVDPEKMAGKESVIKFRFEDLNGQQDFWLLVKENRADLCLVDPGRDVSVWFNCTLRTMHDVWMGERPWRDAIDSGDLRIDGDPALLRSIRSWLRPSMFEAAPRNPWPDPG